MNYFIYNLIIHIFFLIISPIYILKILFVEKYRKTCQDRFALNPDFFKESTCEIIWFHAASAGEVKTARTLINELNISHTNIKLFLTTSTHSGFKLAWKELKDKAEIHMIPLDLPWLIGPVVKKISPALTVIIEPDIWPNFIKYTSRQGKLLMVNAWFDKKVLRRIDKIPGFLPEILQFFNRIAVQNQYDSRKFSEIAAESKIEVTGNIKYNQTDDFSEISSDKLKKSLNITERDLVFAAGSTHKGEEEILLRVYEKLKGKYENLVMVIAPRHIERSEEIIKLCRKAGLQAVKRTQLEESDKRNEQIIILDTMGELVDIYPLAVVTFMGGTLIDQGGHNILEPLAAGNPVIFGPNYYNFREIFEIAIAKQVGYKVNSESELLEIIDEVIEDKHRLTEINNRARKIISENRGALSKTINIIEEFIYTGGSLK